MKILKYTAVIILIVASYLAGSFYPIIKAYEEQVIVKKQIKLPEDNFFFKQSNYKPSVFGTIDPGSKCVKYMQKANVYYVTCGFVARAEYFE